MSYFQCCGALRGGAKPIFAPAGALGRGEAILRPGLGRWGGAKPFCAPAGALGRGEAILRPELGRWGGALMYFGPSGAPHAPVITNMKFENIFLLIFLYKKRSKKIGTLKIYFIDFYKKRSNKITIFPPLRMTKTMLIFKDTTYYDIDVSIGVGGVTQI